MELFLQFLAARIAFELGFYERAQVGFQQALAVETLYDQPPARNVLHRWLARSFAYGGNLASAEGILGVWAVAEDPRFVARLNRRGFAARSRTVRARGNRGARHTIFVAQKKPQPKKPRRRGA